MGQRMRRAFSWIAWGAGLYYGATSMSGAEVQVYLGNLHSHTQFSDGTGTPE